MESTNQIKNSIKQIHKLYEKLTYFDMYTGSLIIFLILCIVLVGTIIYTRLVTNIQPIKDNWAEERCNPTIIPFAGLINKPEGANTIDYTEENFKFCMQNILTSITGFAVDPITFISHSIGLLFKEILNTFNRIRVLISNIRTRLANIADEIMTRIASIMVPIQEIIVKFVDTMGKVRGILFAGLLTSLGSYYTLKALIGAILEFLIKILIILAAIIVVFWMIPFTWGVAAAATVIFLSISIPLLIIIVFMTNILNIHTKRKVPGKPRCFDKNTLIRMKNNTYKDICNIIPGDELFDDSYVTSIQKLNAAGVVMYNLDNIIVSGTHVVFYRGKMISVSAHPNAKQIDSYIQPVIYCMNTSSKKIVIGDYEFTDWDELTKDEREELFTYMKTHGIENPTDKHIHGFFDGGYYPDVMIDCGCETVKKIKDIRVGDVLNGCNNVYGIVKVLRTDSNNKYLESKINPKFSRLGKNVHVCEVKHTQLDNVSSGNDEFLYHLLTDQGIFHIEKRKVYDYNVNIEICLPEYRGKLLSMKYV